MAASEFRELKTAKFKIIASNDGNNIIEFHDTVLFVDRMVLYNELEHKGIIFSGTAYRNIKAPVYSLPEYDVTSIAVNEFRLDVNSPDRIPDYSLHCSDHDIQHKLKKIMKIPIDMEDTLEHFVFVEILHSTGMK